MAKKLKKGDEVVALSDGEYYEAVVVAVYKSGKVRVDFGNDEKATLDPKKKEVGHSLADLGLEEEVEEEVEEEAEEEVDEEVDEEVIDDIDIDDIDDLVDEELGDDEDEEVEEEVEDEEDEEVEDEEDEEEDDDEVEEVEDDEEEDNSTSWFAIGDDRDEDEFKQITREFQSRFYLKKGATKKVVILSDQPLTFREHQVKIDGNWRNWFTCINKTSDRCPLCESGNKSNVVKAFWILDPEGYYSEKEGKQKKNVETLLVMKTQSYEPFKTTVTAYFDTKKIHYGGLKVSIARSKGKNSPNTGDVFVVQGKDPKNYKKLRKSANELADMFKPKTRNELLPIANLQEYEDEDE
jgi:hypothetical protein